MATRTWLSTGSTDMNNVANYSGSGALLTTDDLVFDATSVVNATDTASLSVICITAAAGYTGTWSDGGQTITVNAAFNMSSGGSFVGTGTLIQSTNANVTFANTGSPTTSTAWKLDLKDDGSLIVSGYKNMGSLKCGYAGKTTTITGGSGLFLNIRPTPLTLAHATGTLTINMGFSINAGANVTFEQGSATINGSSALVFYTTAACVITLKALTATLTGGIYLQCVSAAACSVNIEGNLTVIGGNLHILNAQTNAAGIFTVNFGGYDITTDDTKSIYIGQQFTNDAETIINLQGSKVTTGTLRTYGSFQDDKCTVNLDTGTMELTCTSDSTAAYFIYLHKRVIFTDTTGRIYLIRSAGARSGSITSAGSTLPDLRFDAPGKTCLLNDNLNVADLVVTDGTFDANEKTVSITGLLNIVGTVDFTNCAVTIGGNYLSSGTLTKDANTTFTFTGDAATITTYGKALPTCTLNNNCTINDSVTFARLIFGVDGKTITFEQGETFTITAYTAADWDGAIGTLNLIRSSAPGTHFHIVLPAIQTMRYIDVMDCTSDTHEVTVIHGKNSTGNTNFVFTQAPQCIVVQTFQ